MELQKSSRGPSRRRFFKWFQVTRNRFQANWSVISQVPRSYLSIPSTRIDVDKRVLGVCGACTAAVKLKPRLYLRSKSKDAHCDVTGRAFVVFPQSISPIRPVGKELHEKIANPLKRGEIRAQHPIPTCSSPSSTSKGLRCSQKTSSFSGRPQPEVCGSSLGQVAKPRGLFLAPDRRVFASARAFHRRYRGR